MRREDFAARTLIGRMSYCSSTCAEREFFIDNLLVRIHFIIVMMRWTGLAPWEFELPFPGSLASNFVGREELTDARASSFYLPSDWSSTCAPRLESSPPGMKGGLLRQQGRSPLPQTAFYPLTDS